MSPKHFVIRKTVILLFVSAAIVIMMGLFSKEKWIYASFASSLLGASYLLYAWVNFMKAKNRWVLPRLKRKKPPETPYFHQNEKAEKPGHRFASQHYSDSLEEEAEDRAEENLPKPAYFKAMAAVYTICGFVMLAASFFIK